MVGRIIRNFFGSKPSDNTNSARYWVNKWYELGLINIKIKDGVKIYEVNIVPYPKFHRRLDSRNKLFDGLEFMDSNKYYRRSPFGDIDPKLIYLELLRLEDRMGHDAHYTTPLKENDMDDIITDAILNKYEYKRSDK